MYTTVIISGGGIKGLYSLGCLHNLFTRGDLAHVKMWIGTSVGSILAGLMACRISPSKIFMKIYGRDFFNVKDVSLMDIFSSYGAMNITTGLAIVRELLNENVVGGDTITFAQVKENFGVQLKITSVNLTRQCVENFSCTSHEDMPIIRAMELSCNIPFIFSRQIFEQCEYIDGSIGDHIPVSLVNDDENEQIACIVTRFAQSSPPQERTCETTLATIVDVLKYVSRVMLIPVRMNVRSSLEKIQDDHRITLFDLSELCASTASSTIDNPSSSTKLKMFRNGYEYARNVN